MSSCSCSIIKRYNEWCMEPKIFNVRTIVYGLQLQLGNQKERQWSLPSWFWCLGKIKSPQLSRARPARSFAHSRCPIKIRPFNGHKITLIGKGAASQFLIERRVLYKMKLNAQMMTMWVWRIYPLTQTSSFGCQTKNFGWMSSFLVAICQPFLGRLTKVRYGTQELVYAGILADGFPKPPMYILQVEHKRLEVGKKNAHLKERCGRHWFGETEVGFCQ